MNMRDYISSIASVERTNGRIAYHAKVIGATGDYFHVRLSPKMQLMYRDTEYSRGMPPDWLSSYSGTRGWEEKLTAWLEASLGFGTSQTAIDETNGTYSEIMSSVVRYGHVRVSLKDPADGSRFAYISCINEESGYIRYASNDVKFAFSNLRELRMWLSKNVPATLPSERAIVGKNLAEWLDGKCEQGAFVIDMTDQEVPLRHRYATLSEIDNWRYVSDGEPLKQRAARLLKADTLGAKEDLSNMLSKALRDRIGYSQVVMDVTKNFAWERGSFGDPSSCYWTSEVNARNMLASIGAYAIRFWSSNDAYRDGVGRCWAVKVNGNAIAIFNAYGRFQLHEIAAILEHATGHKCIRMPFSYSNIYINNEKVYGFNCASSRTSNFYLEIDNDVPQIYRRLTQCRFCNEIMNPTGTEEVPNNRMCARCEERQRKEQEELARVRQKQAEIRERRLREQRERETNLGVHEGQIDNSWYFDAPAPGWRARPTLWDAPPVPVDLEPEEVAVVAEGATDQPVLETREDYVNAARALNELIAGGQRLRDAVREANEAALRLRTAVEEWHDLEGNTTRVEIGFEVEEDE